MTVRTLANILDKSSRRTAVVEWSEERAMLDYAPECFGAGVTVVHNGHVVEQGDAAFLKPLPDDELIFYHLPAGLEIGTILLIGLIVSVVLTGVSIGLTIALAPSIPSQNDGDLKDSDTYGFDGIVTTVRPGTVIPVVYGSHRVGGHAIQSFQRPSRVASTSTTGVIGEFGGALLAATDPIVGELHTQLGLCVGPIAGVSEVLINDNPATDFQGVRIETRLGTQHQSAMEGFDDTVIQKVKNSAITNVGGPITFTTDGQVDAFEVIFRFGAGFLKVNSSGAQKQHEVQVQIAYRVIGEIAFADSQTITLTGSQRQPFDAFWASPRLNRAQYEIEITRLSEDDDKINKISDLTIFAINDVLDNDRFSYPYLAQVGIRQLPTNLIHGAAPAYSCLVKGKLIRVFSDVNTYAVQWSDNPAWCLLDLLTDPVSGLGAFISDAKVDIQSFIDWAAFCDLPVAVNEEGQIEKQFRLNIVLDGSLTSIDAIKQITSTGRANFLLHGNRWAVRPEKAEEPVQLFSMGRIQEGKFRVEKSARSELANFFTAEFWNEETNFDQDSLAREDPTLLESENQIPKSINLLGTTNLAQANRLINFYMLSNRLQRRHVELEVGAEAIAMEAGDVFLVAHDVPGWGTSGIVRTVESNGTTLILDRQVSMETGKTYEITVIHNATDVIEVKRVLAVPGTDDRITIAQPWEMVPVAGETHYSFGEVAKSTVPYRCLSITQGTAPFLRKIRGIEYNAAVYGTDLTVLPPPSVSRLPNPNEIPPNVTSLRVLERDTISADGTIAIAIDLHFTLPAIAGVRAQIFWREAGLQLWQAVGPLVDIGYATITENVESPGQAYEFSVVTLSSNGNRRHPDLGTRLSYTTVGVIRIPGNVQGFRIDRTGAGILFSWDRLDRLPYPDVDHFEIRVGSAWDSALLVTGAEGSASSIETTIFAAGENTYLIKARNRSGRYSATAAVVVYQVDSRINSNVVFTRTEEPNWTGNLAQFSIDAPDLLLETQGDAVAWRARLQIPPVGAWLVPGGRVTSNTARGAYTTAAFQVTATAAVRCLISTTIRMLQIDAGLYWTSPDVAGESWTSDFGKTRRWAEAPDGSIRTKLEMRFSSLTSADEDFGPWAERAQGFEALVKWAQARLTVEILDPSFIVRVTNFSMVFDVPEVIATGNVTSSSSAVVAVVYPKLYNFAPEITASVLGATAGDDLMITNRTAFGFDLEVKNAGARVGRSVSYTAIGF